MSTRSHSQVNASQAPSPALVADGLLQRKCACGANLDFAATCHECSNPWPGSRRPPRTPAKPSPAGSSAQDEAQGAEQNDAEPRAQADAISGHDFSRV
ncbi:MAG TPA: hypothetical protein VGC64_01865, partial [Pyrinomonadaceae bacterium]